MTQHTGAYSRYCLTGNIRKFAFLSLFVMFLLSLCNSISSAEYISPQEVAERLQEKYDATISLSAGFTQTTSSQMSRRAKKGKGTLTLLKPGRMRWDYEVPDEQVIVCDGKDIIMYFASQKQMLVSPAKQYLESDVTYSFFAGKGNLLRDFTVETPGEEDVEAGVSDIVLRVSPKKDHPQIDYILLWTDEKFLINRLMIVDTFGSTTDIIFNNVQLNLKIAETLFSFTPPEGTEIITQ